MISSAIKERWRATPHKPGVYLMKDAQGGVIYVGKAKDLKRRLSNYFSPARAKQSDRKTQALIASIVNFDYYETRSDQEALLLEQRYIKDYRPYYNIQFRDDKRFYLLCATLQSPIPRFKLVRQRKTDGARYLGPFAHATALKETMEWINRYFSLRSCSASIPTEKDYKHCHADIIRNCSAPCIGRISSEAYNTQFQQALDLFDGKGKRPILDKLKKEMEEAAEELNFEQAATLRDIADNIVKTLEPARRFRTGSPELPGTIRPDEDLAELAQALGMAQVPAIMECFDISNLSSTHIVASMVRFSNGKPDNKAYRRYRIRSVEGQNDFASMIEVIRRRYSRILKESEILYQRPPNSSAYQWLKQLSAQGKAPITVPDLVIVDGGKGQLSSAMQELASIGMTDIPIIGLAKQHEEIFFPNNSVPLRLNHATGALRLMQRIRDEAHRFANNYNELLVRKRVQESVLDACPGMSLKRKMILLSHFKSIPRLKNATAEELSALPGISTTWANKLLEWLKAKK